MIKQKIILFVPIFVTFWGILFANEDNRKICLIYLLKQEGNFGGRTLGHPAVAPCSFLHA